MIEWFIIIENTKRKLQISFNHAEISDEKCSMNVYYLILSNWADTPFSLTSVAQATYVLLPS